MFYAVLQTPTGNISRKLVGVGQLDVFFVLVAGEGIEIDRSKINSYIGRLSVGNAGVLVVTGIMYAVIVEKMPAPYRQIMPAIATKRLNWAALD